MSYDIYLRDPVTHQTIHFDIPHHMAGGTMALGGTSEAWLNVTYNYHEIFCQVLGDRGVRSIYGKTGAQTIPLLKEAASKLADDTDPDYWKPTEGNIKRVILQLLAMAGMRPDGVWTGD